MTGRPSNLRDRPDRRRSARGRGVGAVVVGAVVVGAVVVAVGGACGGGGGAGIPGSDSDRQALLADLGTRVLVPTYEAFATRTEALVAATGSLCAALGTPEEATARTAAQDAWRAAIDSWQIAEAVMIGPAAMDGGALRDTVYSWPVVSTCAVDQGVALLRDDPAFDLAGELTNRRGLDALEYALFAASLDHTCPAQSAPAGWDVLPEAEKLAARCAYARAAAADLAARAEQLRAAWAPGEGDFAGRLARSGESGGAFATAAEAVNAVSDALFFADSHVKDMKLAEPAGITDNRCATIQEPCADELESQHARYSRDHAINNLRGFQHGFLGGPAGGDGFGFDDLLRSVGAGELAGVLTEDIAAAVAAAEAIPDPLSDALVSDYDRVVAAHAAIKTVTDNLKSQFLTVLGLDIPDSAAGDND